MNETTIKNIFNELDIEITNINSATNSFNSNVYIINSTGKKYVLKISNNENKMITESKYMTYLSKYINTSKVLKIGTINDKNYIVMTFFEGKNKFDEEANLLSKEEIKNIGILLAKLHSAPLIDLDNESWIDYLTDALEKVQEVLKKVFNEDNEIIYNYLKKYINNKLRNNYKNCILHMDFRIGNLIFDKDIIGLIDMESMKNGDYVFDFVKMNRNLTKDNFNILLDGYKSIKDVDDDFYDKLNFYSIFDSYTSLWWSASRNKIDTDFYKTNYDIVSNHLEKLRGVNKYERKCQNKN